MTWQWHDWRSHFALRSLAHPLARMHLGPKHSAAMRPKAQGPEGGTIGPPIGARECLDAQIGQRGSSFGPRSTPEIIVEIWKCLSFSYNLRFWTRLWGSWTLGLLNPLDSLDSLDPLDFMEAALVKTSRGAKQPRGKGLVQRRVAWTKGERRRLWHPKGGVLQVPGWAMGDDGDCKDRPALTCTEERCHVLSISTRGKQIYKNKLSLFCAEGLVSGRSKIQPTPKKLAVLVPTNPDQQK